MALSVSLDYFVRPTTDSSNDGSIFITASGGNPPYTYSWDYDGSPFTSRNLQNLDSASSPTATIEVTVTDSDLDSVVQSFNLDMTAINPVDDISLTDSNGVIHLFPDYEGVLEYQYNAGSIEGLKSAITEQIEIPKTDRNLTIADSSKIQIRSKTEILFNGFVEVLAYGENNLNEYIEIQILDDSKFLIRELKNAGLHDLLEEGEYDHKFRLPPNLSTGGIIDLTDSNEFVRYAYQDYNGLEDEVALAINRYNEEITSGDGIQQLQPAFMLNKMIERIENKFNVNIISKFFSNTSESGFPTDKLAIQPSLRYHGFDLDLREDNILSEVRNANLGVCGFREDYFTAQELNSLIGNDVPFGNFRYNNRIHPIQSSLADPNGFRVFNKNPTLARQEWVDDFSAVDNWIGTNGMRVNRSGTYKFSFSYDSFPDLMLMYISTASHPLPFARYEYIKGFSGSISFDLAISVNGGIVKTVNLKELDISDFTFPTNSGSQPNNVISVGGNDHYRFITAAIGNISGESEDIELITGDYVEFFFMVNSKDSEWNVAETVNASAPYTAVTSRRFSEITDFEYRFLTFAIDPDTSALPEASPNPQNNVQFSDMFVGQGETVTINCQATIPYPLTATVDGNKSGARYEEVDFDRNLEEFVDVSLYDILRDVMGRFNMGIWYSPVAKSYYIDNFAVEYLDGSTANNIEANYDDNELLETRLKTGRVRSISLENEAGDSESDKQLSDINFGDLEELVLDDNEDNDIGFSSIMTIANGEIFGKEASILDYTADERSQRFIPNRTQLQVSDYGFRIGFVRDDLLVKPKVYVPTIHPPYNPNFSSLFDPVVYYGFRNSAFEIPTFTNIDSSELFTLEFAVNNDPNPITITTTYEAFWKWYVENLFGGETYNGSFVFNLEDALLLSPTQTYDFGKGKCTIVSFDSLDLFAKASKVKMQLRKI